jgi:hypothetical protein
MGWLDAHDLRMQRRQLGQLEADAFPAAAAAVSIIGFPIFHGSIKQSLGDEDINIVARNV